MNKPKLALLKSKGFRDEQHIRRVLRARQGNVQPEPPSRGWTWPQLIVAAVVSALAGAALFYFLSM